MSFFSFLKKNKKNYSLVINIGSGSISGGIINFTDKEGVEITHYVKEVIPFQQEISVSRHLELTRSTIIKMVNKLQIEFLKDKSNVDKNNTINRVFYIFSSPWSVSQTKTIKIKESKAFKVSDSYLDKLIDKQEKLFQTDVAGAGKIIERKIIQIKINGYAVNDVYNKSVKELEVSVYFTVVPNNILNLVEEAVRRVFNVKEVWCHSLSLSIFSVIRNLFPQREDFIHIDVSEEITDISIIKDDIVTSNASIPFGRNDFIRELSNVLGVSTAIADSMIKMHCAKNNDDLAALKLSVAMDKAAASWLAKIFEILDSFKEKIYVPEYIFLIANSDLTLFLKDKLQKHDFKVILVDNKKIRPQIVGDDILFKLELMFLDNLYKI